jgi:hypothetical protein
MIMSPRTGPLATIAAFAFLIVAGGATGSVMAQTPPTSTAPDSGTITHAPTTSPSALPTQLQLTAAQKASILNAIRHDARAASPVSFVATIGAPVPPSIELYMLPDNALMTVPEAKVVKYTVVQNQVVLVDPTTMRVVDVLAL